jgi:hypothetical protein
MLQSKIFWIILILVALGIWFSGAVRENFYVSQTEVLVIPKSEKSAANLEQTMETVRLIPGSLSFYDKLLEKNPDIIDRAAGLPSYQRKINWNEILRSDRVKKSALIRLSAQDENPLQAELLSKKSALDVSTVAAKYYDVRSELEIRIFDGPVTRKKSTVGALGIIFSLAVGFAGGAIGFLLFSVWQKNTFSASIPRPQFEKTDLQVSFPYGKPDFLSEEERERELVELKKIHAEISSVGAGKKSAAPSNLPIGEEFVIEAIKNASQEEKFQAEEKVDEIRVHEATPQEVQARLEKLAHNNPGNSHSATPEEVKERLNKLLRGEI